MEPDRRNLLQYFNDPPMTWRGFLAGLAVFFVVLAVLASWDLFFL